MNKTKRFIKKKYILHIDKRNVWQLVVMYLCLLSYIVFLTPNRHKGIRAIPNLRPIVDTLRRFQKPPNEHFWPYYIEYWGNIIGNILLFVPFGFLLAYLFLNKNLRHITLLGMLASCTIEFIQLLLKIGVCDIDDVILNTCGCAVGVVLYRKLYITKS